MDSWVYFVFPLLGGLLLYSIINASVRSAGQSLNNKFVKLGTLSGKTYNEIAAVVGPPNAVSKIVDKAGNPITLRQWIQTGYHIALLFDTNDVCLGVSSEIRV